MPRKSNKKTENQIVNLRMPIGLVEEIERVVSERRYNSRSEFIVSAVRYYLDYVAYTQMPDDKGRAEFMGRLFARGSLTDIELPPAKKEKAK